MKRKKCSRRTKKIFNEFNEINEFNEKITKK